MTTTDQDMVEELATLLTAGRLTDENKKIITDATKNMNNLAKKLKLAQKLMVSTAEFNSNNVPVKSVVGRHSEDTYNSNNASDSASDDYKAVVYLFLGGGCDSFNMLVPHTCAGTEAEVKGELLTLDEQYTNLRGTVALNLDSLHE
eukprot:11789574-Ditylum_brightwellii.AAC.1